MEKIFIGIRKIFVVLAVTFVMAITFYSLGAKGGEHAEMYNNLMTASSLAFTGTLIYAAYRLIVFLKRKTVEQVKRGVSATAHGKKNDLCDIIRRNIFSSEIFQLQSAVRAFAQEKGMDEAAVNQAVAAAVPLVIKDALADGILTHDEESSLKEFLKANSLTTQDISDDGKRLLARGAIVRDLLEGRPNPKMDISGVPYKPVKGEIPIWGYKNMAVAEIRNVTRFEGGAKGASVRVAKGVYWRVGRVAAERVTSSEVKDMGIGSVLVTSHYLFYHVGNNSKRIKHERIFNITPYSDAVVVHMDGANAKPLVLKTDDSWFLANVLQNAQNWT